MGFYNVQQGDVPYFKSARRHLFDERQLSSAGDGRHRRQPHHARYRRRDLVQRRQRQSFNAAAQSDGRRGTARTPGSSTRSKIRTRYPAPTTGTHRTAMAAAPMASPPLAAAVTRCAPTRPQPGVKAIVDYLTAVKVKPNCEQDHYYLLNNYNPGYYGDGTNAYADIGNPSKTVFTIPPSSVRNIGDALLAKNISFAYFGDQFNRVPRQSLQQLRHPDNQYCNICNFFQYSTSIMTNDTVRERGSEGHARSIRRPDERQFARGVVRQAERLSRRPPGVRRRSICSKASSKRSSI